MAYTKFRLENIDFRIQRLMCLMLKTRITDERLLFPLFRFFRRAGNASSPSRPVSLQDPCHQGTRDAAKRQGPGAQSFRGRRETRPQVSVGLLRFIDKLCRSCVVGVFPDYALAGIGQLIHLCSQLSFLRAKISKRRWYYIWWEFEHLKSIKGWTFMMVYAFFCTFFDSNSHPCCLFCRRDVTLKQTSTMTSTSSMYRSHSLYVSSTSSASTTRIHGSARKRVTTVRTSEKK